jgi:hypothetical protein
MVALPDAKSTNFAGPTLPRELEAKAFGPPLPERP